MSDAAYHREYRKSAKWKAWSKAHEAKPERVAAKAEHHKKYADENPELVAASKVKCRMDGRAFARAAKNKPCADCGGSFPVECMDFDHRPGTEKHPRLTHRANGYKRMPISMTALATQSLDAFKVELEKCDVVCSNCHRTRTRDRMCGDHKLDEEKVK